MNYSGEAAEQVVRMSLNGVEVAAKISGKAAERLAVLLYAILRDQKKTSGKIRLANMLKSGKELKVFAVRDGDLKKFCEEAKRYGVLYCVLKDNTANDGLTDIMVRAEDASKINRIFERFNLATVDMGSVRAEIQKAKEERARTGEDIPAPERVRTADDKLDQFLEEVVKDEPNPTAEQPQNENPTMARTGKSRQSEPLSGNRRSPDGVGGPEPEERTARPSVRREMQEIRETQRQRPSEGVREIVPEAEHIPVPVRRRTDREEVL